MRILLDTADLSAIRRLAEFFPLEGVTTNPTILAKEGGDLKKLLMEIRETIGDLELHVQVTAPDYAGMIREAEAICNFLGKETFVKIPVTANGLRAIEELAQRDFLITATAILTPTQAMLAAEAGATYVAPYVGRCTRSGGDGIKLVKDIDQLFTYGECETAILAASFKTVDDILQVGLSGAEAATVSPELLEALIAHPTTDSSVVGFAEDWKRAFGGKPLYELLG